VRTKDGKVKPSDNRGSYSVAYSVSLVSTFKLMAGSLDSPGQVEARYSSRVDCDKDEDAAQSFAGMRWREGRRDLARLKRRL
jgi:hypothetical protein